MKRRILFFLSVSMMLLVLTALDLYALSNPEKFNYGPVLWTEKLSTEPEKYIVLTDPDPYLLEALSDPGSPGRSVFVGSWGNTNIDELIETHETNNVEYSKTYYTVHIEIADTFIYGLFFWILIFSWVILGLSFVVTYVRSKTIELRKTQFTSAFTFVYILQVPTTLCTKAWFTVHSFRLSTSNHYNVSNSTERRKRQAIKTPSLSELPATWEKPASLSKLALNMLLETTMTAAKSSENANSQI